MRRPVFLLLALTCVTGLVVGTGGFTSGSADRTTEIAVVGDERAYLGIAEKLQCGAGSGIGENKEAVVNRFPSATIDSVTLSVAIPATETGALRIGPRGSTEQIGPGESTRFALQGPFDTGESATVQVKPPTGRVSSAETVVFEQVEATGTSVGVAVTDRRVDVHCPAGTGKGAGTTPTESGG